MIGQTARLEERPVIAIVPPGDPGIRGHPGHGPTDAERERKECSFSALEDQEVVYEDDAGNRFRLAPAVIVGGDIAEANAILGGSTGSEWAVQIPTHGRRDGPLRRRDHDGRVVASAAYQIAIVVDRVVISSPTVQSPITAGTGDITGGFTEAEATRPRHRAERRGAPGRA